MKKQKILIYLLLNLGLYSQSFADVTDYVKVNSTSGNANAVLKDSVAIGNGASVTPEGGAGTNGVAIGTNARSHVMTNGNHEKIIVFGRTQNELPGGIAIGKDTHARIGNVELGNRDYRGKIGDFDLAGKDNLNVTTGIGSTAVGDNSYAMGNFQSINGAYNVITKSEDVSTAAWAGNIVDRGTNALRNAGGAVQGMASTINGTFNSIEANEELNGNPFALFGNGQPASGLMYSGFSSTIVGSANRINKSNGSLIVGSGNEITNSYITPTSRVVIDSLSTNVPFFGRLTLDPTVKTGSVKELADSFRKYAQENKLASVGVIGGANKADYSLFTNITGVGNTVVGKGGSNGNRLALDASNTTYNSREEYTNFSAFNNLTGYENTGENIYHSYIAGSHNTIKNAEKNIIMGNNHNIKGVDENNVKTKGNILIGFNDKATEITATSTEVLENTIGLGNNNLVRASNSTALGNNINIDSKNTQVLGNNIGTKADGTTFSTVENSVYLGTNSNVTSGAAVGTKNKDKENEDGSTTTAGATGKVENVIVNGVTYGNFAGAEAKGAVSVGSAGEERRLQNLAAGEISKTSTDAINGSQLYSVIDKVKTDLSNINAGTIKIESGSDNVIINSTENAGKGKDYVIDINKNLNVETVKAGDVTLSTNGIDAGNKKITNVAKGTDDTDAVNVSQLREIKNNINEEFVRVKNESRGIGAGAAALAALHPMQYDRNKPNQIMAGFGNYKNKHAVAVGVAHYFTENLMGTAAISLTEENRTNSMINLGLTWKFGKKDDRDNMPDEYKQGPLNAIYKMQEDLVALKSDDNNFREENIELKKEISVLKEELKIQKSKMEILEKQMKQLLKK